MPLFPITWQYNNQPIEVLAADIIGMTVNTGKYIPVSTGYSFIDSPLKTGGSGTGLRVWGEFAGQDDGILMQPLSGKYYFGAYGVGSGLGNRSYVEVDDAGGAVTLKTAGPGALPISFGVDSINQCLATYNTSANTAGTTSGKYLVIRVDNTTYKIDLLNNA